MIEECDNAFENPVAERIAYSELLDKVFSKGKFIFAYNGKTLGYCAFYANDAERRTAYITLIAVAPEFQKMHIGTKLLSESFDIMRTYGMEYCLLEVRKKNQKAIQFYKKNQFTMVEERLESYLMKYKL